MSQLPNNPISDPKEPNSDAAVNPMENGIDKMLNKGGKGVFEMMSMTAQIGGNPIQGKMTSQHITKLIEISENHDQREYDLLKRQQDDESKEKFWNRIIHFLIFIVVISLLVFVVIIFRNQPSVLGPILSALGGIITGFLGGYGYAKKNQ